MGTHREEDWMSRKEGFECHPQRGASEFSHAAIPRACMPKQCGASLKKNRKRGDVNTRMKGAFEPFEKVHEQH